MNVLIVDDCSITRKLVSGIVASLGHSCTTAADGDEAWRRFREAPFDVIVSDLVMPGLDGLGLCQKLRASQRSLERYTYFICMTSLQDQAMFMEAMKSGADDFLFKPCDAMGLEGRLIAAERVTALHRELAHHRRELELLNSRLFEEGRIDALTKVGNRLALDEALASLLDRASRYQSAFALAIFDVDFFKGYNDAHGHLAGDEVLLKVARGFRSGARTSDEVYRFGGEEFILLLAEQTLALAAPVVERHREQIIELRIPHTATPSGFVSVSAGLSWVKPGEVKTANALMREADAALYLAKQSGRNKIALYEGEGPRLWFAPEAATAPTPGAPGIVRRSA